MSSQIQNFYPNFAPNQVLTDTQLNHMRIYLDEQNRLTRTRMIGTGIICGLHAAYIFEPSPKPGKPEVHTISISDGYGVSSEGYLIDFPGASYKQYRLYTGLDEDEDGNYDYEAWANAQNEIFELVPIGADVGTEKADYKDDEIHDLERQHLDCRVLVLYVECKNVDLKSCSITDCGNKGQQTEFDIKALLVHENDLDAVLPSCRLNDQELTSLASLQIYIPRLHTAIDDPSDLPANEVFKECKLLIVNETKDINEAYMDISVDYAEVFIEKMEAIVEDNTSRGNFLNLPDITPQLEQLAEWFDDKRSYVAFNQYHFGMIRDLACGFNEFLAGYCRLVKTCAAPTGYPKHLMLRRLIDDLPASHGGMYRNVFEPTPVRNVMHEAWSSTRDLFMRLTAMIDNFREAMLINYVELANNSDGIRITPSQDPLHPIGQQAVPYYYRVQNENLAPTSLVKHWQADSCCFLEPIHSYYYHGEYPPTTDFPSYPANPLHYGIQKKSFYRIEGHLGKNCEEVRRILELSCKRHNLEFDLLVLYTDYPKNYQQGDGPALPLFREFAAKKWGMEYMGGVKPGGTFILVCDPRCEGAEDDIVVADFALNCCTGLLEDTPPIDICPAITDFKQNPIGAVQQSPGQYQFDFEVETIGTSPIGYRWDFGDGSAAVSSTSNTITHNYTRPYGDDIIYLVSVTIDGGESCENETRTLEVTIPFVCPAMVEATTEEPERTENGWEYELEISFDLSLPTNLRPETILVDWGEDGNNTAETFNFPGEITHVYPFPEETRTYQVTIQSTGPGECTNTIRTEIEVNPPAAGTIEVLAAAPIESVQEKAIPKSQSRSVKNSETKSSNLSNRRQARIQALYAFNEGGTYSRNRTYQAALEFAGDENLSAAKLNTSFKDVLGKLKSVYKRATGQKESDYQTMMSLVMQSYMDRLVELAPSALPTEAKQTLTSEITDIKTEFGIKASNLKKAWKAADIKKVSDAKVIDQINKLIK